ncbi:QueG-associated DUF1730 domain-containing protein, partial [Psychrobacter sp. 1U2]
MNNKSSIKQHSVHSSNQQTSGGIEVTNTPVFATAVEVKQWIKSEAQALGFADCGFLSVHHPLFAQQIEQLQQWLDKGYEGQLQFMHNNHDLRAHPAKLVAGAQTIISVRMDYLTQAPVPRTVSDNDYPNQGIIARYARGRD